jgi:2-keto-4-pentenoate hydratase
MNMTKPTQILESELVQSHASQLLSAYQARAPRPLFAGENAPPLATGYAVQQAYVVLRQAAGQAAGDGSGDISGYKAALTNTPGQQSMGMTTPAAGVLFAAHGCESDCQIQVKDFALAIIETEIAYRLGQAVTAPVTLDSVSQFIDQALPVVEIADAGFVNPNAAGRAMVGADLVATNAAAGAYIAGEPLQAPVDTDAVVIDLYCGDKLLGSAQGTDSQGSQRAALVWLINHTLAQGYPLLPGHLLMTGSLGRVHLARPGHYLAQYRTAQQAPAGDFGSVAFEVV